jgi:hypothetical protein
MMNAMRVKRSEERAMKRHEETRIGFTLPDGRYVEGVWTGSAARALAIYGKIALVVGAFWPVGVWWLIQHLIEQ